MTDTTTTSVAPTLAQKVETLFNKFDALAPTLEKILGLFPGTQIAAGVITAVDSVGEHIEGALNGTAQTDSALLAANQISQSTGDAALDARLVTIETWIESAGSFLGLVGKEMGLGASVPATPAQQAANAAQPAGLSGA